MNFSRIEKSRTTRQPLPQPRARAFRQPPRYRVTLWVASLLIAIVATGAHAQANPGDILVTDPAGGLDTRAELFRVDAASSTRTVISDFNNPAQGEVGFTIGGVAVDASGNILVIDTFATGFRGALFSVNPATGARTVVSDFSNPAQGVLGETPLDVTVDVSNILVIDDEALSSGALFSVDPTNGFRTVVSDFTNPAQGPLSRNDVRGVAVDAAGNILVIDGGTGRQGLRGVLFRVNSSSGTRTILSDFDDPAKGEQGDNLNGLAIDASGNIWVLALIGGPDELGVRSLFKVDPATGARTVVSNFRDPAQGREGGDPTDVAIDASGNILVIDREAGTNGGGMLFSVDPATGARTVVNDFGDPAQGVLGESPVGVAVALTPPTLQPVDLTIRNMEITQAIQNFANDVPLVQDKTTYVRVYPKVDMTDRRAGARLRGFRGGAELPGSPLRPLYPLANVHTGGAPRATVNDSFNFWVPPAWRSGNVSFQAEINFGGAVPETDPSNNAFSLPKEFTRKAPVCVVMIPVRTHGSRYTVNSPGFNSIIARFGSLWPVPEVGVYFQSSPVEELQARFGIPPFEFGPYELPGDGSKVIISLIARDTFTDDPDECDDRNARTHYVGMVSPDTNTGTSNGLGNYVFAASWVKMRTDPAEPFAMPEGGGTMAHELSHNYNGIPSNVITPTVNDRWFHVNCGDPDATNDFYPYAHDTLGPLGNDTFWGFDPISKAIINPDVKEPGGAADYMSYCYPRWVSDYTWRGMFDEINTLSRARVQSLEKTNEPANLTQSAEILVVGGVINPTENVASFDFAYRLSQGIMSARKLEKLDSSLHSLNVSAAAYVLELVDANGAVLFSQPFDSTGSYEDDPGEVFFLTVPFDPNTAHIRITGNGRQLGALSISAHTPEVRLFQPIGGETIADRLTIQWEASDQDNDPLLYTVQYSADLGASWQSLVTQTPETTLTLEDTLSLPGSNQQALIRVIANDGVNTGSDTSNPFTVQPHLPVAHIDTPSDQAIFALNSQVILMGRARDAEDGLLDDEALKWLVNGEVVGVGKEAAVGGLAVGTYDVTLKAVDRDGNAATAGVTITVADTPVASPDGYTTPANTPLTVEAPGVLNNDTDPEADPLSAVLVSDVSNGTLTLNAAGSFTYTPNADFSSADSFTYKANDGTADSNVVTVSLIVTSILVDIDIKPGSDSNPINPNSQEIIPVAILTTGAFDATQVDPLSVEFGPNGAAETHKRGQVEDVDGDGDRDLLLHFNTQDTGIECGDTSATLTGVTLGGQVIEGTDSITTVGCKDDGS